MLQKLPIILFGIALILCLLWSILYYALHNQLCYILILHKLINLSEKLTFYKPLIAQWNKKALKNKNYFSYF